MKINSRQTDMLSPCPELSESELFGSSAKHSICHENRFGNFTPCNYDTVYANEKTEEKSVGYADF